jgi:hypothetical protein
MLTKKFFIFEIFEVAKRLEGVGSVVEISKFQQQKKERNFYLKAIIYFIFFSHS